MNSETALTKAAHSQRELVEKEQSLGTKLLSTESFNEFKGQQFICSGLCKFVLVVDKSPSPFLLQNVPQVSIPKVLFTEISKKKMQASQLMKYLDEYPPLFIDSIQINSLNMKMLQKFAHKVKNKVEIKEITMSRMQFSALLHMFAHVRFLSFIKCRVTDIEKGIKLDKNTNFSFTHLGLDIPFGETNLG